MKITIIPQAAIPGVVETAVSVSGDILTVGSHAYDLSAIPEGGIATPEAEGNEALPFVGPITRTGGEICLSVSYQYDPATAAPHQPKDLVTVKVSSGALPDPITRLEIQP